MSKDFCQDGVAVSTQFGVNGPRFKSVSGALQARDAGDTAFAVVSGADPVADDDFVTKRWGLANLGGGGSLPPGLPHSDSIVFYVDASDPGSYPGTGTVVTDRTGNATNGSLDGGTVVSGGAFVFDETVGKGVGFDKNATLDNLFDGPATVMTFIRQNAINSGSGRFVSTESGNVGWGLYGFFVLGIDGIRPRLILRSGGGTDGLWSGAESPLPNLGISGGGDAYGSFAVTLDASTLSNDPTFYTDGQTPSTPSGTNPSALGDDAATDLIIGNDNGGTLNPPTDSQVTIIWDRILTETEIRQVHNLLSPRMLTRGGVSGTATVQSGGRSPHLIRTGGLDQSPGIPESLGNTGCTDLGLYSDNSKGITGTGIDRASILGGHNNEITAGDDSCIVSGVSNLASGGSGVIAGGSTNVLVFGGPNFIGAGSGNRVGGSGHGLVAGFQCEIYSGSEDFIGGGFRNDIGDQGISDFNVVVGGYENRVRRGSWNVICGGRSHDIGNFGAITNYAFIGGGSDHTISASSNAEFSGIVCGQTHTIEASDWAFIGGGQGHTISGTSPHTFIGGGESNAIRNASVHAAVVGGENNDINLTSPHSAIGGGSTNDISTSAFATIPGGRLNDIANADYAYAGGRQSKVTHAGANVTSDGNAINADSIVAHENFQAFSGGIRRVTTNGFRDEAWVSRNSHLSLSGVSASGTITLGSLLTADKTLDVSNLRIHGIRTNSTAAVPDTFASQGGFTGRRRGAAQAIFVQSLTTGSEGTGAGVTAVLQVTGNDYEVLITLPAAAEDWQFTLRWERQEGGFTS